MSAQRSNPEPEPETPNQRRMFPSLLAAVGATGSVLAAAAIGAVLMAGALSFDVSPEGSAALDGTSGQLSAPAGSPQAESTPAASEPASSPAAIASSRIGPGGSVVTPPDPPTPKLGNSGLHPGAPPPRGAEALGEAEGGAGSPGGSGIAGEDDDLGDVGFPIDEPTDPRGEESAGDGVN